jgi:hypothetical protein
MGRTVMNGPYFIINRKIVRSTMNKLYFIVNSKNVKVCIFLALFYY